MPYEILVHISAPTTKDDDDRYRREALAYRNFKPARTIYLDGRDGQTVVPTFQHPRHHALQHEQPRQIHWNPRKTRRSNSLNEIEPNWSNSAPDTIGTQVILDTQRAVGAFDSQISFITNSTYDGEPMSWDEQQPAKRPRTAKSIEDDSSSGHHRGAVPASYPSSPNKSPYARVTSFPGLDPASSLLPDSYGLSKSGGTNSIRRLEEAANTMRMSPFPASLQNSGIDVSRSYRPSEETAAAAVLLGLRAEGNQANSNISTFNPPSRVFSPAVDVTSARAAVGSVGELLQNRANTPEHRMLGSSATSPSHSTHDEHAHRNGAKTALTHSHPFAGLSLSQNAASSTPRPTDPIQQNNATRNGGTTTSSPSDVARKGSLRREAQPDHVRSRSNETGKMWASTAPLPVSNRNSPRLAPLFSAISRTQNSPEVNEFHHEVHPTRADEGMSDVDMEDQEIDEDETQNERSTSHAEEMITEYQEENQFVARQAPILSLAEKSELASSTKNGRIRLDDGVALEIRRQQPVGNLVDLISPEPKHRPFRCTVVDCGMAYQDKSGLNYHKEHGHQSQQLQDDGNGMYSILDIEVADMEKGLALDPEQEPLIQNREERIIRSEPVQGHTTTPTGPNTIAAQPMEPVGRASELTEEQNNLEYVEKIEKLPLEVFSSRAPVGIAGSEAAITFFSPISRRIADKFAEQPKLRNRWKRASFSRPIKQFDLGHWVIETRTWTPKLQLTFWKDLIKQIELKALGNSTWCKRVPEPDQMGTVMVYCWGELVEHVYLILMTISDAKIKSQEVCWLDGENKVVVRVR